MDWKTFWLAVFAVAFWCITQSYIAELKYGTLCVNAGNIWYSRSNYVWDSKRGDWDLRAGCVGK